jgi:hypothetical protein
MWHRLLYRKVNPCGASGAANREPAQSTRRGVTGRGHGPLLQKSQRPARCRIVRRSGAAFARDRLRCRPRTDAAAGAGHARDRTATAHDAPVHCGSDHQGRGPVQHDRILRSVLRTDGIRRHRPRARPASAGWQRRSLERYFGRGGQGLLPGHGALRSARVACHGRRSPRFGQAPTDCYARLATGEAPCPVTASSRCSAHDVSCRSS